jgi:lipoprotein-releasing system ATP-binding protein
MLQLIDICKSYEQRGVVLDKLELTVNEGDTISISGPSGSGKTTLLNIIGMLDKPDSGTVSFRNDPVLNFNKNEAADFRSRNIGFVFQDHLLLPHLTVHENIILPLLAKKLTAAEFIEKQAYAEELMKSIGIHSLSQSYPENISGGEAQRTALIRALVNKPSLLLADEPTGSLDRDNAENLGNLLAEINIRSGISVLLATHSQNLAMKMNRKLKLENGRLIPY